MAVEVNREGAVAVVTINRPEVYNCVNGGTARLLLEAWRRFRSDDSLSVAVFHGAGDRAFCSGADLKNVNDLVDTSWSEREVDDFVKNGTGPMGGTRIIQHKDLTCKDQD